MCTLHSFRHTRISVEMWCSQVNIIDRTIGTWSGVFPGSLSHSPISSSCPGGSWLWPWHSSVPPLSLEPLSGHPAPASLFWVGFISNLFWWSNPDQACPGLLTQQCQHDTACPAVPKPCGLAWFWCRVLFKYWCCGHLQHLCCTGQWSRSFLGHPGR